MDTERGLHVRIGTVTAGLLAYGHARQIPGHSVVAVTGACHFFRFPPDGTSFLARHPRNSRPFSCCVVHLAIAASAESEPCRTYFASILTCG